MKRLLFALLFSLLLLLLVASCEPAAPTANANMPPVELVGSGPTQKPVLPEGGTLDDPVFLITNTCSAYGVYQFDIRYSPDDLRVVEFAASVPAQDFGGGFMDVGWIQDNLELDPYSSPIDYRICYGNPDVLSNPCDKISVDLAGCPAFVPDFELTSFTCEGNSVHFEVDVATGLSSSVVSWQGESMSPLPGGSPYSCITISDSSLIICGGSAPDRDVPLNVCISLGSEPAAKPEHCAVIADFYDRYQAACAAPPPASTEEPAPEISSPVPPACSVYTSAVDCEVVKCYWWNNSTCNPIPDACRAYDGNYDACKAASCSWVDKDSTCQSP